MPSIPYLGQRVRVGKYLPSIVNILVDPVNLASIAFKFLHWISISMCLTAVKNKSLPIWTLLRGSRTIIPRLVFGGDSLELHADPQKGSVDMTGPSEAGNRVGSSLLSAGETSRSLVSPVGQATVTTFAPSEDVQPQIGSSKDAELDQTKSMEKPASTDCVLAIEASLGDGAKPQSEKRAADTVAGAAAKRFFQSSSSIDYQKETSASFQFAAGPAFAPDQFSGVQRKALASAVGGLYAGADLSHPYRLQSPPIRSSHVSIEQCAIAKESPC